MIQNAMPSECYDSECNAVRVLWFRVQCHQSAIIIIKKISRAPIYHTRCSTGRFTITLTTHTHTHTHIAMGVLCIRSFVFSALPYG